MHTHALLMHALLCFLTTTLSPLLLAFVVQNMKRLFLVHPNFWVKLVLAFVNPFVSKKFWKKLHYVEKLMDLYLHFDPQTLRIPSKILQYDQDEFPASYTAAYAAEQESKSEDAQL